MYKCYFTYLNMYKFNCTYICGFVKTGRRDQDNVYETSTFETYSILVILYRNQTKFGIRARLNLVYFWTKTANAGFHRDSHICKCLYTYHYKQPHHHPIQSHYYIHSGNFLQCLYMFVSNHHCHHYTHKYLDERNVYMNILIIIQVCA